jgi:hypothetical protein
MSKLIDLMAKNKLTLIVSLPENSAGLAKAAIEGGADALKVHINITHKAAGTKFGSLEQERAALEEILEVADVPVGIVPGENVLPDEKQFGVLVKMGFDFYDIKVEHLPAWCLKAKKIGRIVALSKDYSIDKLMGLSKLGVDGVEAAIVSATDYGKDLNIGDLQGYISIAISAGVPVVVPTQKAIRISEVPIIADTGAKGLMIGAIVTGKTAASIKKATRAFRAAIDDLG